MTEKVLLYPFFLKYVLIFKPLSFDVFSVIYP